MRRTFLLLFILLCLAYPTQYAQITCPPKGIEDCPESGCGGWDKQLDLRKNIDVDPESLTPISLSLEEIKKMKYPEHWFVGKDRLELKSLGEGTAVRVDAYLIAVRYGDATSANCKLIDPQAVNQLLILVGEEALKIKLFGDQELTSVTAQLTPRVRRKHPKPAPEKPGKKISAVNTTNWTKRKLDALISRAPQKALKVKVTGLLLLDTDHIYNPIHRSTDWEIHPVLGIEVLCASKTKCNNVGQWMKLNDLDIKDVPRKRRGDPRARVDMIP